MRVNNTYFHDRVVLFLLTVNTFVFFVYLIFVLLNFEADGNYFIQYRAGASIDEYKSGGTVDILAFPIFASIVYIAQFFVSKKIYLEQKHASWAVMLSSILILVMTFLTTWALFKLH